MLEGVNAAGLYLCADIGHMAVVVDVGLVDW
jgi:hypothetical protein